MLKVNLILLAGGLGNRMKEQLPKQHILLYGKPIIMHILERIDTIKEIDKIIVTCPKDFLEQTISIHRSYNLSKPCKFIEGGASRQESVYFALRHVISPTVIIHEAARPFVRKDEFEKLIRHQDGNVILGLDIPYTVLEGKEFVEKILDRSRLINVQLPQKFETEKLLHAHEQAREEGLNFTEDASLFMTYYRDRVSVISGTEYNIKITRPIDLRLGEVIYKDYIRGEE